MAIDFHDRQSGFRHREVIRFINSEIIMNDGGPEFYVAFRSQPWTEVEDRLSTVVVDSQVPRTIKRACAWSALALSVRATARQWEQQARQVLSMQEKMEGQEELSLAKTAELQRLREEHEEAKKRLYSTRAALEQALSKRNILHGQLLQTERSTQGVPLPLDTVPQPQAQPQGAEAWTLNADQYGNTIAMGAQGWLHGESPMVGTAPMAYMPSPPNPFTPVIQHPLPMPGPQPFPFHVPHPVAPVVVTGAESTATPLQMPPQGLYQPHLYALMDFQAHTPPLWNQSYYGQGECLYTPHGTAPLGNSKFNSQEESPKRFQETAPLGNNSSLHQEEGPGRSQKTEPLGDSKSHDVRDSPKKQKPQGQKAEPPNGKKASESQQWEKPAHGSSTAIWKCQSCGWKNFSWRTACYKCKEVYRTDDSGDLDPGQAPH